MTLESKAIIFIEARSPVAEEGKLETCNRLTTVSSQVDPLD